MVMSYTHLFLCNPVATIDEVLVRPMDDNVCFNDMISIDEHLFIFYVIGIMYLKDEVFALRSYKEKNKEFER